VLLDAGSHERFKGGYHVVVAAIVGGAGVYSAAALIRRRLTRGHWEPHLVLNLALDLAIVAVELQHVQRHFADA
jgi:hypothetical protein